MQSFHLPRQPVTETSVINWSIIHTALFSILAFFLPDDWDVVVIIRGGGATSDLSGFDTYELAANCAQFPLPIITGIGHERDDTVLDSVSHTRVKTPTAAAEFLINHLHDTAETLEDYASSILYAVTARMEKEKTRLTRLVERIPMQTRMRIQEERHRLE